METAEAIVVGAGISGLSAARALAAAGVRTALLEASDDVGGRIRSLRVPGWREIIELGAEFVHGAPDALLKLIREARLQLDSAEGTHYTLVGDDLAPSREFDAMQALLGKLRLSGDKSAFELAAAERFPPEIARFFRHFVENFHAAPLDRISARSVLLQASSDDTQRRVREGYRALVDHLFREFERDGGVTRLATPVRAIQTSAQGVRVLTPEHVWSARVAVIALPLALLKAQHAAGVSESAVAFDPEPDALRENLAHFSMGRATRVVLRFRNRFPGSERLPRRAFLHLPEAELPTWWTGSSDEELQLTAWCGASKSERFDGMPRGVIQDHALSALALACGAAKSELERALIELHYHDFHADPSIRGAYPFALPGARVDAPLPTQLAGPQPLFFAGDYFVPESMGTVGGAVSSAELAVRAARERLMR